MAEWKEKRRKIFSFERMKKIFLFFYFYNKSISSFSLFIYYLAWETSIRANTEALKRKGEFFPFPFFFRFLRLSFFFFIWLIHTVQFYWCHRNNRTWQVERESGKGIVGSVKHWFITLHSISIFLSSPLPNLSKKIITLTLPPSPFPSYSHIFFSAI